MDTGKGPTCSTDSSNDCPLALAGGVDSCSFALRRVESFGKPTQFYGGNLMPRSRCKSSAALQSCWVQRLNLFNSTSDVEEEVSGRKPPGKHVHVWTHFAKDFSSCRRPNTISHNRSSSWPPDGLTDNEAVSRRSKSPAASAGGCNSSGPRNHKAREMYSLFSDGNLLVPSGETTQCCGADSRTENRSDSKSGSPHEALVPCLQHECSAHRKNLILEAAAGELECKSQNLATRHFRQILENRQGSQSNTGTGECFSRLQTRKQRSSFFGSENITASPAISRSYYPCEMPRDIDAKESFLSTFVSASKADNRGARADADRRLLVSPADIRKDQVIGRPERVAIDTVDDETPDPIISPVELGHNTGFCSDAPQTARTKGRLSCEQVSSRETSRKNVIMRFEAGERMNLMEHATESDNTVSENLLLFSCPCTERVWHGLSEEVREKCGRDSKVLAASARRQRSCAPEKITKERWNIWIHDEDAGPSKSAESFSSTDSLLLDYLLEQYHESCVNEATNSLTKDTGDRLDDCRPGLDRSMKAGAGIHYPRDFPPSESFSRLGYDSVPLKQGKRQMRSKETHQRGDLCKSTDEDSSEKRGALTALQGQNHQFVNGTVSDRSDLGVLEPSGRIALQVHNKNAARIKHSDVPLDLDLLDIKWSPKSRFCSLSQFPECLTNYRNDGVSSSQQAWIQRWSSSLHCGAGSVNSLRHATEKKLKLSSDIPDKLLASGGLSAMHSTTSRDKEKSCVGCIGQRDSGKEGNRNMGTTVTRIDCGFKYILGSCLPMRNQGKYVAPKAQAMAIVGATRQIGTSPLKNRVLFPIVDTAADHLQTKRIPEDTSCSSRGNGDADMDILEFLGS